MRLSQKYFRRIILVKVHVSEAQDVLSKKKYHRNIFVYRKKISLQLKREKYTLCSLYRWEVSNNKTKPKNQGCDNKKGTMRREKGKIKEGRKSRGKKAQ
jgi:hypothetical protein